MNFTPHTVTCNIVAVQAKDPNEIQASHAAMVTLTWTANAKDVNELANLVEGTEVQPGTLSRCRILLGDLEYRIVRLYCKEPSTEVDRGTAASRIGGQASLAGKERIERDWDPEPAAVLASMEDLLAMNQSHQSCPNIIDVALELDI